MPTTADFLQYTQWSGIATIAFAVLTILAFILKWGIRFRLVGTTGFMIVLTAGLFSLSLVPLSRTVIPGAVKYTLVYDNGSNQAVIATKPEITPEELEATLRQAASNLYSYGRLGAGGNNQLTIRARTIIHPEPGISIPVYLGKVERTLVTRADPEMSVEVYLDKFAQLPEAKA
ncbi:Ycf51 family protein [Anabaena aphanizomenioides LEGE 00250]|uniref:Ycf51 family protein n=1 Tax=Sphaerospermopsis aphanizomenoides LEGE 00250 TaxID=2777972 RepID=A0ABR9V9B1_9CYAN|nr:Ycf51 family protein [Sphaerospermopsis aphanizomenoides]MBE9234717.1 Ycf51 family protein [Sphaerospermopsis aphanizomenoides LEGE 00250]